MLLCNNDLLAGETADIRCVSGTVRIAKNERFIEDFIGSAWCHYALDKLICNSNLAISVNSFFCVSPVIDWQPVCEYTLQFPFAL